MQLEDYIGRIGQTTNGTKTHRITKAEPLAGGVWLRTACGQQSGLSTLVDDEEPTCKLCLRTDEHKNSRFRQAVERGKVHKLRPVCACCTKLIDENEQPVCPRCVEQQRIEVEAERHAQSIEPLPEPFEPGWYSAVVHAAGLRPTHIVVDGPPCPRCKHWNPHVALSTDGTVHKVELCTDTRAASPRSNFTCYQRRS